MPVFICRFRTVFQGFPSLFSYFSRFRNYLHLAFRNRLALCKTDFSFFKYLNNLLKESALDEPYWVQMLFGGSGTYPCPEMMMTAAKLLPEKSMLSIIALGACQSAMITLGIILGHHVRVGLEDNYYYGPHELAVSNAQFVERVVRIARELGRPIATPAQAREMMGLGEPRSYSWPE